MSPTQHLDAASCHRAVKSRDRRFDGVFWTAVHTTGIYCRPSCPARTPALRNVSFHPTAASAQAAGFRACKRCLPDATPGSPDWDVAADVAGRAMQLVADGLVDREGVEGLATAVGYTPRHLTRLLTAELGAGPLALARARRAQTARVLIETTHLSFADIAFAAGFSSVRQFNDTVREVYASSPTQLRGPRKAGSDRGESAGSTPGIGELRLRVAVRTPFGGRALLRFLEVHAVPGVELVDGDRYLRTMQLPHGVGVLELTLTDLDDEGAGTVPVTLRLADLRDTGTAVSRIRRLVDADADPRAISDAFVGDPVLGPLRQRQPGLRVPRSLDADEVAIRAVIGQQVSVAGARTVTGRIAAEHGEPLETDHPGLNRLFPTAAALADVDPSTLPMPRARGAALRGLCAAVAEREVVLDGGADRDEVRKRLLELPGIGPWTADVIALRGLGHPDVFLPTDLVIRKILLELALDGRAADLAEQWRPWRSYALMHLWTTLPMLDPDNSTHDSSTQNQEHRPCGH